MWLEIDANLVRPGWTPLLITVGLGLVLVLLGFSMRKQLGRISPDLPYEADLRPPAPGEDPGPTTPPQEMDPQSDVTVQLRKKPDRPG